MHIQIHKPYGVGDKSEEFLFATRNAVRERKNIEGNSAIRQRRK